MMTYEDMLKRAQYANEYMYDGLSDSEIADLMWNAVLEERERLANLCISRLRFAELPPPKQIIPSTKGE